MPGAAGANLILKRSQNRTVSVRGEGPTVSHRSKMMKLEKKELEIRFIPVLCGAPLIYAQTHGFFKRNGLSVNLQSKNILILNVSPKKSTKKNFIS